MAFELQAWASKQKVGNVHAKFVLYAICNHANTEDFSCFPSAKTIARMTEQSQKTIYRSFDLLEEKGFIKRTRRRRKNGNLGTYRFELLIKTPVDCVSGSPVDCQSSSKERTAEEQSSTSVLDGGFNTSGLVVQLSPSPVDCVSGRPVDCQSTHNLSVLNKENIYTKDFEVWKKEYPKKVTAQVMAKALDPFLIAMENIEIDDLLERTIIFKQICSHLATDQNKFIPHPATWLKDGLWADENIENCLADQQTAVASFDELAEWEKAIASKLGQEKLTWFKDTTYDNSSILFSNYFSFNFVKNNYARDMSALGLDIVYQGVSA